MKPLEKVLVCSHHQTTHLGIYGDECKTLFPYSVPNQNCRAFEAKRKFAYTSHRWKERVKALCIELDDVPVSDRWDDHEDWWARFSDIISILKGRVDIIPRVCEELGTELERGLCCMGCLRGYPTLAAGTPVRS